MVFEIGSAVMIDQGKQPDTECPNKDHAETHKDPGALLSKVTAAISCVGGVISIGLASHDFPDPWPALLYIISVMCFVVFISSMSSFYAKQYSLYKRGMFSMHVSMLIIIAEIVMKCTGLSTIFSIVVLDLLNGYVFIRARKILLTIAHEIIVRYKGRDHERRIFSLSIVIFGVLFIGLQVWTVCFFIATHSYFNPLVIGFCVLQMFAAYWGSIITRLGVAVYNGYEPGFATRERERFERLEAVLMQRRALAETLAFRTLEERSQMIEAASREQNITTSLRVKSRLKASPAVFFLATLGGMVWVLFHVHTENWAITAGKFFLIFLALRITWNPLKKELERYKNTYILVSLAGISFYSPERTRQYLWQDFMRIDIGGMVRSSSTPVVFHGYYPLLTLKVTYQQCRINLLIKAVKKHVDAPEIMSDEMKYIDMRKFVILGQDSTSAKKESF